MLTSALLLFGYALLAGFIAIAAITYNPFLERLMYYPQARGLFMAAVMSAVVSTVWGFLLRKGLVQVMDSAKISTGFFSVVFAWQAVNHWMAALGNVPESWYAASLYSLLWIASVGLMLHLWNAAQNSTGTQ